MKYFTAGEAVRIVGKTPVHLVALYDDNPNREAMRAVAEKAASLRTPSVYMGMVYGFQLGRATGIREERAKRREQI